MKAKKLLELYEDGRRDFRAENLRGQSFKGKNLSGADFSGADIRGADFTNAYLQGAKFVKAQAGLQRRWAVSLVLTSWLLSGISGFLSLWAGIWLTFIRNNDIENIIANRVSLTIIVVLGTIAIGKELWKDVEFFVKWYAKLLSKEPQTLAAREFETVADILRRIDKARGLEPTLVKGFRGISDKFDIPGWENPEGLTALRFGIIFVAVAVVVIIGDLVGDLVVVVVFAFAFAFAFPFALALAVAEVLFAGAFALALVVAGAFASAGAFAFTVAVVIILLSSCIGWRAIAGNPQEPDLRFAAIAFAAIGGTSFRGADLTDADFTNATLKNTDLRRANLTRTCWKNAIKLHLARPGSSYLKDPKIRKLVLTGEGPGDGRELNCNFFNLQGVNLQGANLQKASFMGANLQGVNLQKAKLQKTSFIGANLNDANLQGAN